MVSKKSRSVVRVNKHRKLRNRLSGTAECPRLAVFRSNNHMYAPVSYTHLDVYKRQKADSLFVQQETVLS